MSKELIKKEVYNLSNPTSMTKLAEVLKRHIKENKLTVNIQGKDYAMVEAWQFAGGMMGLFPKIVNVEKIEGQDIAYQAEAHIINVKNNEVMGSGFAMCSASETKGGKKVRTDQYAVLSMSQTRAIGKAYRNLIGWVMKMTGNETTPAEEIQMLEMPKNKLEEAKSKINACKVITVLMEYDKKIQGSKKYSKEQKKELHSLIMSRANEIEK